MLEQQSLHAILNLKVGDLYHLRLQRVEFMGDLVQRTEDQLRQAMGFGKKSLASVKGFVEANGLRLGMTSEELRGWLPPRE